MKPLPSLSLIALTLASLAGLARAENQGGSLQAGDLVGICGDSITEQKIYSVDIADYLLMCQPKPKLTAIQFGWSGERAPGFLDRMTNDALVFKPTVVTTCYGMNDGGYGPINPVILDTYTKSMTGIVETFKSSGVRFIVVGTPGAVDTSTYKRPGSSAAIYNETLAALGQAAKEIAAKEGVGFADVHGAMIEAMAKAKAANGETFPVAGGDGVHPNLDGHLIMAYAFLKGLGCDGNIGTITVDLQANQAEATEGTKVLSMTNGVVELESTRYPFCFPGGEKDPNSSRSMLPFLPFNEELNRYTLVVKNATGKLKVTWGTESKTYSAEDLAKGINLAAEFLDNPFVTPFTTVQDKIGAQQIFETLGSKLLLHSLLAWNQFPEAKETMDNVRPQLVGKIISKWEGLRDASTAAIVPVKHELKIEAGN